MVNWSDPQEIATDYLAFERIVFVCLGVVIWELVSTWEFEWSLLSRRRKFRWPLIFFFFSRYCILSAIIGLIVSLTVKSELNCRALYIFNSWSGNMTLLCSSTSLMLRTIALWERQLKVIIPLGVLCASFWGLLWYGMFIVRAEWDDTAQACVVVSSSPQLLNVVFFFTMAFDLIILFCTFVALTSKHTIRTDLWKLLFRDGLIYFLVTFSANCIPAVLNVLNLNTPMNVIATIPAAVISSIASCRAVMRLLDFNSTESYIQHTLSVSIVGGSSNQHVRRSGLPQVKSRPEVLVTTEHITMTEYPHDEESHRSQSKSASLDLERDAGRENDHYSPRTASTDCTAV